MRRMPALILRRGTSDGVVYVQVFLVLLLALALFIAIFALQNAGFVEIRLLFWQFDVSLVLVIIGSALLGAVSVMLAGLFRRRVREKKKDGAAGAMPPATSAAEPGEPPEPPEDPPEPEEAHG